MRSQDFKWKMKFESFSDFRSESEDPFAKSTFCVTGGLLRCAGMVPLAPAALPIAQKGKNESNPRPDERFSVRSDHWMCTCRCLCMSAVAA